VTVPKSRYVSAARLKPLIAYFALAFVAILVLGTLVPGGPLRTVLIAAWIVFFPVGGWLVFRRNEP